MTQTGLAGKVRELKELKLMAEELAAQITGIEDEIKHEMTAQGVDTLPPVCFELLLRH